MTDAFDKWREDILGTEYEIWHDGLDEGRLERLSDHERERTLSIIPIGLVRKHWLAPLAARKLGAAQFLPEVESGLEGSSGRHAIESARAMVALGGDGDRARAVAIAALPLGHWSQRMDVAIGIRHIPSPEVIDTLAHAVALDSEYLVRYHAAESLLHIGGAEERDVSKHADIFRGITAGDDGAPTEADLLKRREAADRLRQLVS